MGEFHNYSPDRVSFSYRGFTITGFMSGTFIDAERKADGWTVHAGALGDVVRTKNLDKIGTVTLTLMAQVSDNDIMQAIADEDEQFSTGIGSLQIMDHNGTMECHADIAWIRKMPKTERAKEAGTTVWILDCAELEISNGGNITAVI